MKGTYLFPIALFVLLTMFFTGLPDLRRCALPGRSSCQRRIGRADAAIMAALTLLYSALAFSALGNHVSPESFAPMWEHSAQLELEAEDQVAELVFFCGVGEGSYFVEGSRDGLNWQELCRYEQNYVSIFKWQYVKLEQPQTVRYIRIYGSGPVYLGELAANDSAGLHIPLSPAAATEYPEAAALLVDEQQLVPRQETFLNSTYFDEIYHARTAWEHMNGVYPYELSHPPLGKLIISLGMMIFGTTPFGWRFMGTLFGALMLPVMYVFAKKLFGGKAVPTACTAVLATDFMHFVQTRIATIDTYSVFFIMLMYLFMYLYVSFDAGDDRMPPMRYLALSGLFFGLGAASKWTSIYAGAGLAVIWLGWWVFNRRRGMKAFLKNAAVCVVFFVLIPALIYYLSYFAYGQALGLSGPAMFFSREYAKLVWENQQFMFGYHSALVAEHPYSSKWYQWMLDIRPILYYLKYFDDGTRSSFGAFVNPALCWGGLLALPVLIFTAIARRDREGAFIIVAYLAQLLPWVFISRLTFEYHYFPCTVFLVLALGYVFKLMRLGRGRWRIYVGSFVIVSGMLFMLFYPALSGLIVDNSKASAFLGWLPTWPF